MVSLVTNLCHNLLFVLHAGRLLLVGNCQSVHLSLHSFVIIIVALFAFG